MSRVVLNEALRSLDQIAQRLDLSEALRASHGRVGPRIRTLEPSHCPYLTMDPPPFDMISSRIHDHCLVYTRSYAILEYFVLERLATILGVLAKLYPFPDLSRDTRLAFRRGVAKIITNIETERYEDLDEGVVSSNYSAALAGQKYLLTPEAVLVQEQNLRVGEIARLFKNCGISGMEGILESAPELAAFLTGKSRQSGTVEASLKRIVQFRNESSHGMVDQISALPLLREAVEFIKTLIGVLYRVSAETLLEMLLDKGRLYRAGRTVDTYRGNIGILRFERGRLTHGDVVISRRSKRLRAFRVDTIQLDGQEVRYVKGGLHLEIGVKFDGALKREREVYLLDPDVDPALF
jgi:hypothetical protein